MSIGCAAWREDLALQSPRCAAALPGARTNQRCHPAAGITVFHRLVTVPWAEAELGVGARRRCRAAGRRRIPFGMRRCHQHLQNSA